MSDRSLTLRDVKTGQRLPPLSYPVSATTVVLGALASRDWRPMHHDHDFAVHRNGVRNIFLNTPNQAAWFERYLTDWTGPRGRLGSMRFRMSNSVFPGQTMTFDGTVEKVETDAQGCAWAELELSLTLDDGSTATTCRARIALPAHESDNPWQRSGDAWQPEGADA